MNRMHVISIPYSLMKVNPLSWIQKVHTYKGKGQSTMAFVIFYHLLHLNRMKSNVVKVSQTNFIKIVDLTHLYYLFSMKNHSICFSSLYRT